MRLARLLFHPILILGLTFTPGTAAADLLDLVPAGTPAFVFVKNPAKAEKDFRTFFLPPAEPEDGGRPGLLELILGSQNELRGLDRTGPMIVAMPQFPFPLLGFSVSDYDLFLDSLRGSPPDGSPPPSPSPVPGLDMAVVSGKPFFFRKEGKFALLSPMPVFLTPPAPGAGMAGSLAAAERKALEESDVYLRVDVGTLTALLAPLLRSYASAPDQPSEGNAAPSREKDPAAGKVLMAETDLLMAALKQVKSISAASHFSESGLHLRGLTLPLPGSAFEKLLLKMEPGSHAMLGYFDEDSAWAGAYRLEPEALAELIPVTLDFMMNSGLYELTPSDMEDWKKLVAAAVEVLGAESAYSFGSSDSGGAFSTQLVVAVNNGDKARALMKDSVLFAERIMTSSPTQPEFEVVLKQGVETYAGIPIDSFRFSLSLPEGTGEQEEFDAIMESMFGGSSLSLWVAVVDDLMVASYYAPTSQELRTLIDRVRKGAHGNLLGSAAFRSATGTLPAESLSLNYFSFPRFASLFTAVMAKAASEQNLPPWPLKEEDLSGMGISYTNPGGILRVDTFVPRAEADNIRTVIEYLKSLEGMVQKGTPL